MKKIFITISLSIFYTLSIFAQKDSFNLDEVSIAAERINNMSGIPNVAVKILSNKTINFINPASAAHLLEQSGQVLIQRSQGGGGSPILRGFEANKVLLVVDGVRMNNAIYRGGHLQNVITLDPNMLDRVEIVFGGRSLMFGSDALGGVMYFATKKPQLADSENLKIGGSVMSRLATATREKTFHADVNLGFEKIAFLTSFTISDFGDMRTGKKYNEKYGNWGKRTFYVERFNQKDSIVKNDDTSLQIGTAYHQYDVLQKVLFSQNQNTTHHFNFQLSNSSDIPRYDRLNELTSKGLPRQGEWYYGPQKRTMFSYQFENSKKTSFSDKIQLVAAWQGIEESRFTRSFNSDKKTQRIENVKVISTNLDIAKSINNRFRLQYGAEMQLNDVASSASFVNLKTNATGAADTRYPDGGSQMNSYAFYVNNRFKKSENLEFSGGFRYNFTTLNATFIDKTFFPFLPNQLNQKHNALVGSLSVSKKFKNDFFANASLSNAYRAPNVDDVAKTFESVAGRLIIPNQDLKSEKTYNAEFVVEKKVGNNSKIQAVPFLTFYRDALTLAPSKIDGKDSIIFEKQLSAVFTTQNLSQARIYGISLSSMIFINTNNSLSTTYTFTKGQVTNEKTLTPLDHIPPAFGRVSWDFEGKKLKTSFFMLFNAAKKSKDYRLKTEDNELYSADPINGFMPSWYTLNLRINYDLTKNIALQFAVENILDHHYRVFASGVSGAGRNFSLTLRLKM